MVGLSHLATRRLIRSYLPIELDTFWPTEMLSTRRLVAQRVGATPETLRIEGEKLIPQILGNERRFIEESVKKLTHWGACGFDINMGCPVKKVLKHNYGVALMGDRTYAMDVVKMTKDSTDLPVSVKLRAAENNDLGQLLEFVLGLQDAGASWLCLHPREAKLQRRGNADWSQIKMLVDSLNIPVVGNGDVQIAQDALDMRQSTGCQGVMIGRALIGRPWLLWQIAYKLDLTANKPPLSPEEEAQEYGRSMLKFIKLLGETFPKPPDQMRRLRFHVHVGHPWLNFGHAYLSRIKKSKTLTEAEHHTVQFFKAPGLRMSERTSLRY